MKRKLGLLIVFAAILVLVSAGLQLAQAQVERLVWALYMPWTESAWDENALSDHPLFLYDTTHAGSVTRQIGQAQNAGIDAFILYWRDDEHANATLDNMLAQAAVLDFQIGVLVDTSGMNKTQLIDSLNGLFENPLQHTAYLRFDGKPVIYFTAQESLNLVYNDWWEVRHAVDPDKQSIWIAEGLDGCCIHGGIFDGMYALNLSQSDPATSAWEQFEQMRTANGWFYTPTAHPGWDDSLLSESPSETKERAEGAFLAESWQGAISSQASIVLIVSWNDYLRNTHVEPSENYGTQALDFLTDAAFEWKLGDPVAQPGGSQAAVQPVQPPPIPPGSPYLTVAVSSMNVRAEPNTTSEILGAAYEGEQYLILDEFNGWYRIPYGRRQGYVWAGYVTVGYK